MLACTTETDLAVIADDGGYQSTIRFDQMAVIAFQDVMDFSLWPKQLAAPVLNETTTG